MNENYSKLLERAKDLLIWQSIQGLVQWDFETKMPSNAVDQRSLQMASLEQLLHEKSIDPEVGKLLDAVKASDEFNDATSIEKRNVHLIQKNYDEQTKLPADLVEQIAKEYAVAVDAWKRAKAAKDYSIFMPELQKTIDLVKQKAYYLDPGKPAYDVLVDLFEPGITTEIIARVFEPLKEEIIPIVQKCVGSENKPDLSFMNRTVPIDVQRRLADELMSFVKYDTTRGRLDETEHPFTQGFYDDVRICTHYYENNFASSIFAVMHEAGHGIYEQDIPAEWKWQPVGTTCSMGIHESQSRFIENIIGRSEAFWRHFLPILKHETGTTFDDVDLDVMFRAANDVKPSKIRIEADEVTYSLHVVLRFEMEQLIMDDQASIDELPQIWNEKMDKYFGIEIENDSEGIMQDTHWGSGLLGYFPDYALGNVYDGMLLEVMEGSVPDWQDAIANGDITPVSTWLADNVHHNANTMDAVDLMKYITGKDIDARPFIKYLEAKMSAIYGY
ncbi:MAG TPA: carboxypeptidase M32 [Candidatus Lokiarchaeia archaeon]|nr:carboxypeptidase M32 [Candidatus Lokiarchaeia archaeon]